MVELVHTCGGVPPHQNVSDWRKARQDSQVGGQRWKRGQVPLKKNQLLKIRDEILNMDQCGSFDPIKENLAVVFPILLVYSNQDLTLKLKVFVLPFGVWSRDSVFNRLQYIYLPK